MIRKQIIIMKYNYQTYLIGPGGRQFSVKFPWGSYKSILYTAATHNVFDKIFEARNNIAFQDSKIYFL